MVGKNRWQAGASLAEVLVAVGILSIAILAFIRLYPSGFLTLKRSAQSDSATRMAQRELERLKSRQDNLPYLIAPIRYREDSATRQIFVEIDPTVSPNDLGVQPNLPASIPPEYASGMNRIRRVIGERVPLGLPGFVYGSQSQVTDGIVYTTTFSPIMLPPEEALRDPSLLANYIQVYGNPMRRFEMDADFQYRNVQPFEYGIDYEQGLVLLRPLFNRPARYKIDYSYVVQNGNHADVRHVSTVIILPPTNPNRPFAQWVPLTVPQEGVPPEEFPPVNQINGFSGIVPDSDSCARLFEILGLNDGWDSDYPYQCKLLNPLLGSFIFSPYASGYMERYWRGTRPLVANIDYTVHDWTILREEFTVPADGRIRLTFTDIKQIGDLLPDQTQYQGLNLLGRKITPEEPIPDNEQIDMVIIDLLTGSTAYIAKGSVQTETPLGLPAFTPNITQVDYTLGILQFNDRDMVGRKIRVLYKVHDNWALSVQKSAHRYFISPMRMGMPVDACWYDVEGAYEELETERQRRLYFNRSEAGKTVLLREYWYALSDGSVRQGKNGVFRISDVPDDTGFVYIDLTQLHPDATRWAPEVTGTAIRGVQGLSLRVRMSFEPAGRPVYFDFDTMLTRTD